MDFSGQANTPLKTALFVDFDNIYIALSKTDPQAAERFASDPARWLSWLEEGHPLRSGERSFPARPRSILVRRCYPNPDAGFRRFRSFFTSAAFSVIDCPSMTHTGKNSSDIYMVMDILDTLGHRTHFDEFIILSGDSDFMPVLLRLRAHDRRTTTLNIDFMPPAFRAACDLVISEEEFIEDALGVSHEAGSGPSVLTRGSVPTDLLQEMAQRVFAAVSSAGEVAGANLPEILKDYREFRDSTNWLGFGTSQRLAEGLAACEPRLQLVRLNPMLYKIQIKPEEPAPEPVAAEPAAAAEGIELKARRKTTAAGRSARLVPQPVKPVGFAERAAKTAPVPLDGNGDHPAVKAEPPALREQILRDVKDIVAGASAPLLLARVSQTVVNHIGHQVIDTQWAGAGSFKRLLQSAPDLALEITSQPEPGYIYDPQRHSPPAGYSRERGGTRRKQAAPDDSDLFAEHEPQRFDSDRVEAEEETFGESQPSLEEFIRRVSRVTGAPDLTPEQYALALDGIVNELQQIARGEKAYHTYQSAKAISDWCSERGPFISRGEVMLILKGIIFQDGPRFSRSPGSYSKHDLAALICTNIRALCRRSQMECSEYDNRLIEEWVYGCLEPPPAAPQAELPEESSGDQPEG